VCEQKRDEGKAHKPHIDHQTGSGDAHKGGGNGSTRESKLISEMANEHE